MVTKVYTTIHQDQYLFRYEEEVSDDHGRKHIRGVPFHVTLTLPQGMVRISKYDYKESKSIEISIDQTKEIIALLEAASKEYEEKVRQMRNPD
jgi:hypothetical protein